MDCPFPLDHDDNMSDEDPEVDEDQLKTAKRIVHVEDKSNFNVEQKPARKSLFDEEIETKEKTAEEERLFNLINIDDDQPDYEADDEFTRQRIHAWVLIRRGPRDVEKNFFIEPTTGRKYTTDNAPYHSIESIFNNKNFWVNLDAGREVFELNLDFDKDVNGEWEYVMVTQKTADDEEENPEDDDESGDDAMDEENLDMPPPWSPKLFVAPEKFNDKTKGGGKTLYYKRCKVDFYP